MATSYWVIVTSYEYNSTTRPTRTHLLTTYTTNNAHFIITGENMNRFLNENWKDIIKEVGPAVADALTDVFRATMGAMADLVPFEYIFPTD